LLIVMMDLVMHVLLLEPFGHGMFNVYAQLFFSLYIHSISN
jgi:hypothetical protein